MAENSNILLGILLAAGVGVGAYWYLTKDAPCAASIIGGSTSEIECQFRKLIGLGCTWDATNKVCTGGTPSYCQQYASESLCTTGNPSCEWCTGSPTGRCIEKTIGCNQALPCQIGYQGDCYWPGQVDCDTNNNSCKCVANTQSSTGYRYALQSANAYNCIHDVRYLDCFTTPIDNPGSYTTCMETAGTAPPSQCYRASTQIGCACPCQLGANGETFYCNAANNKCYMMSEGHIQITSDMVTKTRDASGKPIWIYKVPHTPSAAPPFDVPFAARQISNIVVKHHYSGGDYSGAVYGGCHVKIKFKDYYTAYEMWGNPTIFFWNYDDDITEEAAHVFDTTRVIDTIEIDFGQDIPQPSKLEITGFEADFGV